MVDAATPVLLLAACIDFHGQTGALDFRDHDREMRDAVVRTNRRAFHQVTADRLVRRGERNVNMDIGLAIDVASGAKWSLAVESRAYLLSWPLFLRLAQKLHRALHETSPIPRNIHGIALRVLQSPVFS